MLLINHRKRKKTESDAQKVAKFTERNLKYYIKLDYPLMIALRVKPRNFENISQTFSIKTLHVHIV